MNSLVEGLCGDEGRGRFLPLFLVLLAVVVSLARTYDSRSMAAAMEPITVGGDVTNGTPGGTVPEDLVVSLHIFSGTEERGVYTTTLGSDHVFGFSEALAQDGDGVFEDGHTLVARVVYDGVTYLSDFAAVNVDQPDVSLSITIFETTDGAEGIGVAQLHVFVNRLNDRIEVGQYCVIGNSGVRTYVGSPGGADGERTTWRVTLPADAQNLRIDRDGAEGRFVPLEDGLADTRPILPGAMSAEASFVYDLPYRDGLRLEQAFDIPVNGVVLVVPGGEIGLEGGDLSPGGTLETEMGPSSSYTAGPLEAGERLAFTVVRSEARVAGALGFVEANRLAIGIAMLAVGGAAAYWLWRSPAPGSIPAFARSEVEAIATLDGAFERGEMSEDAYRERRRVLKQRLREQLLDHRR